MARPRIQDGSVKKRVIAFRIEDQGFVRLKEIADRYGISVSDTVRQLLDITLDKLK